MRFEAGFDHRVDDFLRRIHRGHARRVAGIVGGVGPPRRIHRPRHDGRHFDVVVFVKPQLLVNGASEAQYGGFGGGVARLKRQRHFAVHRAGVNQHAEALGDKMFHRHVRAVNHAFQVHIHQPLMIGYRDLPEPAERPDTDVIDPDVNRPEARDRRLRQALHLIRLADVCFHRQRVAVVSVNLLRQRLQRLAPTRRQHDVRAAFGKRQRGPAAKTARRPGDNDSGVDHSFFRHSGPSFYQQIAAPLQARRAARPSFQSGPGCAERKKMGF